GLPGRVNPLRARPMNETEIIREQLATERQHASAVANACASALGRAAPEALGGGSPLVQFRQACVDYPVWDLARFEERDQPLDEELKDRKSTRLNSSHGSISS